MMKTWVIQHDLEPCINLGLTNDTGTPLDEVIFEYPLVKLVEEIRRNTGRYITIREMLLKR